MKVYELVEALMDSAVGSEVLFVDGNSDPHRVVRASVSQDSGAAVLVMCEPAYPGNDADD